MIARLLTFIAAFTLLAPSAQAFNPPPATTLSLILQATPSIKIQLPPRLIMTPDKLLFPDYNGRNIVFGFVEDANNYANSHFDRQSGSGYDKYKVRVGVSNNGSAGAYYTLTVYGFTRDEAPAVKDLRLTFKEPVSKANIDALEEYLKDNGNSNPTARLSGPGCQGSTQSHICLETKITARGMSASLPTAYLRQTIGVVGTFVPGNVAAPGTIGGFSLGTYSIAVGGTITASGGTPLPSYLLDNTVTFRWNNVSAQVNDMLTRGRNVGTSVVSGSLSGTGHYTASSWNLNAILKDPVSSGSNSFSNPPEGKIWRYGRTLYLDSAVKFKGAGTIIVDGDLNINQPLSCDENGKTRLTFFATGNININTNQIGCGAYFATGGGIVLRTPPEGFGNLTGIFVANGSVTLPNASQLISVYSIASDTYLTSHPTALLQELLSAVFGTNP